MKKKLKYSPLIINLEPLPGSNIDDCFDQALRIAITLGVSVKFKFNGVHCNVRESDGDNAKQRKKWFIDDFNKSLTENTGYKFCYANESFT